MILCGWKTTPHAAKPETFRVGREMSGFIPNLIWRQFFADSEPTGSAGGRPEPRARRRMGGRSRNGVAAGLRDYGKCRQPHYCLIKGDPVCACGRVRWSCKFNLLFLDFTQCCPETVSLSFSFYECLIISFTTLQVSHTTNPPICC